MALTYEWEWDVFVSHNKQQKSWIRSVVQQWKDLGLRVFFDEEQIRPGDDIVKAIDHGLSASRHIVLVITPSSMASKWVAMERSAVIASDPDASERRLIPLLLEPTDLSSIGPVISRLRYVDLSSVDPTRRSENYRDLLSTLLEPRIRELPDPPMLPRPLAVPEFHYGSVVPVEYFVGREEELLRAERTIQGGQSFLLLGAHREGKTSLCRMLVHRLMSRPDNHVLPVYINVQFWPDLTLETFLEHTILSMIGDISRNIFGFKYSEPRVSS
jgi:hypothetical protein